MFHHEGYLSYDIISIVVGGGKYHHALRLSANVRCNIDSSSFSELNKHSHFENVHNEFKIPPHPDASFVTDYIGRKHTPVTCYNRHRRLWYLHYNLIVHEAAPNIHPLANRADAQ